jgi:hypothetical protein
MINFASPRQGSRHGRRLDRGDVADVSWRDLLAGLIGAVVPLVAINLIRGDVLPLSTALVGLPLGGTLAALGLAYAKRRTPESIRAQRVRFAHAAAHQGPPRRCRFSSVGALSDAVHCVRR